MLMMDEYSTMAETPATTSSEVVAFVSIFCEPRRSLRTSA
jgi:hypothetical protein